ncbi:MAG: biotin--[acetyl-CoA-carboxylase] ligase [Weissella hellenica]|uniref:biotin--[acetyl-CoA-carboxylase] ligase n=1 Tax=Weissella hellenica TaxID=46256 RepID=UPI003F99DA11
MVTTTKQKVLFELLAHKGDWLSGDQLATDLAVSRESIWKAINALKKKAHQIESRKNLGYQYIETPFLDEDIVGYYMDKQLIDGMFVEKTVTSTQHLAKQYLTTHTVSKPVFFAAEAQSAGYGRRGRHFYSPATSGLYFTIVLPNTTDNWGQVGLLTTNMAVVIAQTLESFFPKETIDLKWVNDLFINNKKVGGIITEANVELESNSVSAFIMGVGLNLTTKDFSDELSDIAQSIDKSATLDRNLLLTTLIKNIIDTYYHGDFATLLTEYRRRSNVIGKHVTLKLGNQTIYGTAKQIASDGGLIIEDENGITKSFTSGEVIKTNVQ